MVKESAKNFQLLNIPRQVKRDIMQAKMELKPDLENIFYCWLLVWCSTF